MHFFSSNKLHIERKAISDIFLIMAIKGNLHFIEMIFPSSCAYFLYFNKYSMSVPLKTNAIRAPMNTITPVSRLLRVHHNKYRSNILYLKLTKINATAIKL